MNLTIVGVLLLCALASAWACDPSTPECTTYVNSIQRDNLFSHLSRFQAIADANNGNRAVGTSGYQASVDYVLSVLRQSVDCDVTVQPFDITNWQAGSAPKFSEVSPTETSFTDFNLLDYSAAGNISGNIAKPATAIGCTNADWKDFPAGRIALVERGTCDFATKVGLANSFGAKAVLIYNNAATGSFTGSMGSPQPLIVFGISQAIGQQLQSTSNVVVRMVSDSSVSVVTTENVLCASRKGNPASAIVVGSHLDSVPAGPGINDNGSGSSVNLELAVQSTRHEIITESQIIFAWWAAEEKGLLGSKYFVQNATATGAIKDIALNLNFDMLASPNGIRQVLNGAEAEDPSIRTASGVIQQLFENFFKSGHLPYEMKQFNGRSDYGPFISTGIPAGGLATGAEVIKNATERTIFGGLCNAPFDPCYHLYCDSIENVDMRYIEETGQSAAYTLQVLAKQENLARFLQGSQPAAKAKQQVETGDYRDGVWPFYR